MSILGGKLRLWVDEQDGTKPRLPKNAARGDLAVIHTSASTSIGPVEDTSVWLCTGYQVLVNETRARWNKIPLGDSVVGTE